MAWDCRTSRPFCECCCLADVSADWLRPRAAEQTCQLSEIWTISSLCTAQLECFLPPETGCWRERVNWWNWCILFSHAGLMAPSQKKNNNNKKVTYINPITHVHKLQYDPSNDTVLLRAPLALPSHRPASHNTKLLWFPPLQYCFLTGRQSLSLCPSKTDTCWHWQAGVKNDDCLTLTPASPAVFRGPWRFQLRDQS